MSFEIHLGWWIVPLAVTVATIGYSIAIPGAPLRGDYSFPDLMPAIRFICGVIVSLIAWLIWALVA